MKIITTVALLTMLGTSLTGTMRPVHTESQPVIGLGKVEVQQLNKPSLQASKDVTGVFKAKAVQAPVQAPTGNVEQIVRQAARKYGINEEHFVSIIRCESNFDPLAENRGYNENGYPSGLGQHLSGYWPARAAKYGYAGTSVFDPVANANVTAGMFRDGSSGLWECR